MWGDRDVAFTGVDACTYFCSLTLKEWGLNPSHATKESTLKCQRRKAGNLSSQKGKAENYRSSLELTDTLQYTLLSPHPQLGDFLLWDEPHLLGGQHQVKLDPRENYTWKTFEASMSTSPGSSRGVYWSNIQQSYIGKVVAEAAVKRSWTLISDRCVAQESTLKGKDTFYQTYSKRCAYLDGQRKGAQLLIKRWVYLNLQMFTGRLAPYFIYYLFTLLFH